MCEKRTKKGHSTSNEEITVVVVGGKKWLSSSRVVLIYDIG